MAEETITTGTEGTEGQPAEGTVDPTTLTGTEGTEGQPAAAAGETTPTGTQTEAEETFFDPQTLDEALKPAYKNMQRAFGKGMEGIKANQAKIDAFNAFDTDPHGTLAQYAKQLGYNLTRAEAEAAAAAEPQGEPQTWDEVYTRTEAAVMKKLEPVIGRLQAENTELRKSSMERTLDESAPDWRQYEPKMIENLNAHPTLANDPETLYRLSVPPEVLESRATQAALLKLKTAADGSVTSGVSTNRQTSGGLDPDKKRTFDDAVNDAKADLAAKGIRPAA